MIPSRFHSLSALAALSLATLVYAANDADQTESPDSNDAPPAEPAQNDSVKIPVIPPLAKWTFESKEAGALSSGAKIADDGPQAPMYPNFPKGNKALSLEGKSGALTVKETD